MNQNPETFAADRADTALERFLSLAGLDQSVAYLILRHGWRIVSVPVTLFLVTTFFSNKLQGYYFTFTSMVSLQVLVEIGFGAVLVQFVSHEWAHLRMDPGDDIAGDPAASSRLASLVRMAWRWYLAMAILFFAVVGVFGDVFLAQHAEPADYRVQWWILCFVVSASFLIIPMRSLIEGSNRIDKSQRIGLIAGMGANVTEWAVITAGGGLFAPALSIGVMVAVTGVLMVPAYFPYHRLSRKTQVREKVSWKREFFPLQWRIGTSWVCGYFMFQSFVPFMYHLHGPEVAGRMGATLMVYTAVNVMAFSWMYAVSPRVGMLFARRDYGAVVSLARSTYYRSLVAAALLSVAAFAVIFGLRYYHLPQADRFAGPWATGVFLAAAVLMQLSNVDTQTVRFQKKEPFVLNSVVGAVLIMATNYFLGKPFGILGAAIGFLIVLCFVLIPWIHRIYAREMDLLIAAGPLES